MIRHSTKLLALLTVLVLTLTPNLAAASDLATRGWISSRDDVLIFALEMDGRTRAGGTDLYRTMSNTRTIERELGITVITSERLTGQTLRGTGADKATIAAVYVDELDAPGLMFVGQDGPTVYFALMVGEDIDGTDFARYTRDLVVTGIERAEPPYHYDEFDFEDDDESLIPERM